MIPDHWPSFWLGVLAWPITIAALVVGIGMLAELSREVDKLEDRIRRRLAGRKGQP